MHQENLPVNNLNMNKIIRLIGGVLLFIGLIGLLVSKSPNYSNKSESVMYGIVLTIVGGAILVLTKSEDKEE